MLNYRKKFFLDQQVIKNIHEIPLISTISVSFFNKDSSKLLLYCLALSLITNEKPLILFRLLSKKRKGRQEFIGCCSLLKQKKSRYFLEYLNLIVLLQKPEKIINTNFSGSVLIKIKDIFIFPELNKELDKFYGLKDLKIFFNLKKNLYMKGFFSLMNFIGVK